MSPHHALKSRWRQILWDCGDEVVEIGEDLRHMALAPTGGMVEACDEIERRLQEQIEQVRRAKAKVGR